MFRSFAKVAFATVLLAPSAWAKSGIDPAAYPKLDKEQVGIVRHFVRMAEAPVEEWDYKTFAVQDNDLRYSVAHVSSGLMMAQYDKIPAYRELLQKSQDQLIAKMMDSRAWNYWYDMSRRNEGHDPNSGEVEPWRDPVKKKNIMYSAYLFQMVGAYRVLYNDAKYDAPGSLTFSYSIKPHFPTAKTLFSIPYDHNTLAKALYDESVATHFQGIECEPNLVFQVCNQYPLAAFMHYDASHGTDYSKTVIPNFLKAAADIRKTTPHGENWGIRRVSTGEVDVIPAGFIDSVTETYGHIWDKAAAEARYPTDRDHMVPYYMGDKPVWRGNHFGTATLFGYFVNYVAELGDKETLAKLLAFTDKSFKAQWQNGEFFYPTNYPDAAEAAPKGPRYGIDLLGGVVLSEARLNNGATLTRLYHEPWTKAFFDQPYIGGVEYPRVIVNRAIYDAKKDALIVGLEPSQEKANGSSTLDVHNLTKTVTYAIEIDGRDVGTVSNGQVTMRRGHGQWSADGVLTLEIDAGRPHSVIVYSNGPRGPNI